MAQLLIMRFNRYFSLLMIAKHEKNGLIIHFQVESSQAYMAAWGGWVAYFSLFS